VKKTLIFLTVLIAAALSLYVYSGNRQRGSAPLLTSNKVTDKNEIKSGPQESPSGIIDTGAVPVAETTGSVPVMDASETPSGEIVQKKDQSGRPQGTIDVLPDEEIKDKEDYPQTLTSETPHLDIKRIEGGVPVEKEKELAAAKKELIVAADTSREAFKRTEVEPEVKETNKPVDKPDTAKEDKKAVTAGKEIKPYVAQVEPAEEKPRVAGEKKDTMPAGGVIIAPVETPAPVLMDLSSAGTKDIVPGGTEKQPSVKMGTTVTVNRTEKSVSTKEIIPPGVESKAYMKKTAPSREDMLSEGNNKRIVIFPFENLSDNRDAFRHVLPLLIDKMSKRGFEVVDEEDITDFLCKERIRFTGYISRELSEKIRKRFNASAVLTGAIVSFSTDEIPEFGILARLIDTSDGTIIWADYSAATGEDFIAILELGRLKTVFSLIPKVIDILFASYRAEELNREIKPLPRIAVMPFKNNTEYNNAGIIATYMFIVEILRSRQFLPIEYGDIRDVIIKQGIRRKGDIGYENIGELSRELKARGIVVGVVDNYSDGVAASVAPNVGFTARLVDGSNKKILWYNSFQLSGEENIIALDWGRIRSVHSVAYEAVSGLVKEMSKKKWTD